MIELRCPSTLQAVVLDEDILEIKCRNSRCGAGSGIVVLHRFNIRTGQVTTVKFREPNREVTSNGTRSQRSSVRSA